MGAIAEAMMAYAQPLIDETCERGTRVADASANTGAR